MSYIVDLLKEKYLNKIKTTKDLIYKDKIIDAHNIAQSYEKLVEQGKMNRFPMKYGENFYYTSSDEKQTNILSMVLVLNSLLTYEIKKNKSESIDIESFKISEIQNSLWIEGVKSSKKKIKQIVKNDKVNLKDSVEKFTSNYNDALNFVLTTNDINESNVFALYTILSRDIDLGDEKLDGFPYRLTDVQIQDESELGIAPSLIKDAMNNLFDATKNIPKYVATSDPLNNFLKSGVRHTIAILIHYHFELVHPYYDMNGRMGRLITIWFAKINGILQDFLYFSEAINMFKQDFYYDAFSNSKEKKFKFDATYFETSVLCAMVGQKIVYLCTTKIDHSIKTKFKKSMNSIQKEIVMSLLAKEKEEFYLSENLILGVNEINPSQVSMAFSELVEWGVIEETNTKPKEYKLVWTKEIELAISGLKNMK